MRINGKEIAQKILEELKLKIQKLGKTPHLAIILIGNDPASVAYVRQKELKGKSIGAKISINHLPSDTSQSSLLSTIQQFNHAFNVHGIIVQQPFPSHIDQEKIVNAIARQKDVDGFRSQSKFKPPISLAVLTLLENINISPVGKNIVILGKGETGGQPIIQTLKKMGINPTVIDSKTDNPEALIKNADIIISAVGKSDVIKSNMIKKGVILISIGLHKGPDGKLHGDYNEDEIKNIASFYTPTPGGVGPVNVAMLLKNLVNASFAH